MRPALSDDETNPNVRGRSEVAGAAPPVEYDRSAAASLKFHAWTQAMGRGRLARAEAWRARGRVRRRLRMGTSGNVRARRRRIRDSRFATLAVRVGISEVAQPSRWPGDRAQTRLRARHPRSQAAGRADGGAVRRRSSAPVRDQHRWLSSLDGRKTTAESETTRTPSNNTDTGLMNGSLQGGSRAAGQTDLGRWPPNVAHGRGRRPHGSTPKAGRHASSTWRRRAATNANAAARTCRCRTAGEATDRQDGSAGLEQSARRGQPDARCPQPPSDGQACRPHALARAPRHAARWPRP